jgi:fumarylacetoacetase
MSWGVDNLPYGVFSCPGERPRVGVRYGDRVLDLAPALHDEVFAAPSLNPFMARGRAAWHDTRTLIRNKLTGDRAVIEPHLIPLEQVRLHMPFEVADYVDFYCSIEHASNIGQIFRPGAEPLQPNWRHLPVGYHGRSGTVIVSGSPVRRPCGQIMSVVEGAPRLRPTAKLDIEAEVGFVVGTPSEQGEPVPADRFADHVFGAVLLLDWSARDIQAFEYVPLGPFLGKSFGTSISPWVVPLEALAAARVPGPVQDPVPLDYLRPTRRWGLDLRLELQINGHTVSTPEFADMYWTADQQLAHMTVNGAHVRTGDLYGSGTVSGAEPAQGGSLLELSWNGERELILPDGATRGFLLDGDVVTLRGTARTAHGARLPLGSVEGVVTSARTTLTPPSASGTAPARS